MMSTTHTCLVAVACCLAALGYSSAAPQFAPQFAPAPQVSSYQSAPALSRTDQRDDAGQYTYTYQTVDGTVVNERGSLKQTPDGSDYVLVKDGSYGYTSPDGTPVQVTYTADENGFHPQSANIPQAPPAPSQTRF
ncbi:hypothetical protein LSTR_LSTR011089 [Laodelphax striatellus]|uniref:Uncharacterized protein n=1 Tax=Laodelphax striatellus TaxID=195883 RepID=A0A482WWA1_LAOST|nr:hypothetical protein LSTR_LSTR011089 [Laodelphax striatellus]